MTDDIKETLSLYLDGELTPADKARVQSLIETDAAWAEAFERLKRTSAVVREFWANETQGGTHAHAATAAAVERIVRESTAGLRKSAVDRLRARSQRNRPLLIVFGLAAILLAAAATVHFVGQDDTAAKLLAEAGTAAMEGATEVRIDFAESQGLVFGSLVDAGALPAECRLETASEGRLHFSTILPGGATQHVGFDGKRWWVWRSDDSVVRVFGSQENAETAVAQRIAQVWSDVRESVSLAGKNTTKTRLLGREKIEGLGELTKIETHLDGFLKGNARVWLDDKKAIRKLTVHGMTFHVTPRRLSAADFEIKSWAPRARIEEVPR